MSLEPVWIVIESSNSLQLPIMTYDHYKNNLKLGTNLHQPLRNNSHYFPPRIQDNDYLPEPPHFMKPHNFTKKDSLESIRLVGVFTNYESAHSAVLCIPNRKLLGPAIIQ